MAIIPLYAAVLRRDTNIFLLMPNSNQINLLLVQHYGLLEEMKKYIISTIDFIFNICMYNTGCCPLTYRGEIIVNSQLWAFKKYHMVWAYKKNIIILTQTIKNKKKSTHKRIVRYKPPICHKKKQEFGKCKMKSLFWNKCGKGYLRSYNNDNDVQKQMFIYSWRNWNQHKPKIRQF